ncbi:MAG TPA: DUF4123 domain-containing protein [Noviherbaspirillum sp.]|nr:DUF4123 domain-containing protein [Noviherbaspirillum sp.]
MQQKTSYKQGYVSLAGMHELRATLDPVTPILVLVDPMLGEPLPDSGATPYGADTQSQREALWQRPVRRVELPKNVPLPAHKHPYLIELQGISDPLLEETLTLAHAERIAALTDGLDGEGAAAHRIGGWLQSSMHLPQLARTLSLLLQVNTEATTRATYLRLADRRVLALLRHVAGDNRVAGQFGRLQRWIYLDMQGHLTTLQSSSEKPTPLRLNREEWRCMEQGEALHRTMAQWLGEAARMDETDLCHKPAQELYAPVRQSIAAARQAAVRWPHRFTRPIDEVVWAALSLLHPLLPLNEAVQALLAQHGTEDNPPEPIRYLLDEIGTFLRTS